VGAMALLTRGFGGFSVVPEITAEQEATAYGRVLVLLGLVFVALVPLTLAVVSGGRGQIGAAVVALGRNSLARLVLRALAVVLVAFGVAMTGTGLAVIGPVAALVAVGVADELRTRLGSR
jgi:hypothetical protein